MFDFVRTHSRLAQGLLVLLIFPSFVFFGIQGYSRFTDGNNDTVAKVDGQGITRGEWELAHQRNVDLMRRQMPNVDAKLFDTPQRKRATLDEMVRERVLVAAATDMHLFPDAVRLGHLFESDPGLVSLRGPDGKINRDILAAQGMTPEMFDAQLRQQFGTQQVIAGIVQGDFVPASVAAPALDSMFQRRELQIQRFEPAAYLAKVSPSDAEIESFYKAHDADFRAPEQANIEYVVLTLDALTKGVPLPEEDLRRYYEQNAARFTVAEERRASHILIKADADKKAAKARADELLAQVRKNPSSFAEVARKNSQDPGSAAQGGDLDFFGRGMMTKPFEDAVFAMKPGEISNVIETDFGYHIIMLAAVRGGEKKPFESVRGEIEAEVRKAMAQKKYAEAAEQFTNTVYEQPDSLQPVIDKFKLDKQTASVQRRPVPGATGALASAKLLDAVFSNDAVRNKRNTDAVEVGPNHLASARIVQYQPAHTLPLVEVKDKVRERLVAQQAAVMARTEGAKRLAELQKAPNESLPTTLTVSRSQSQALPAKVLDAVLRADASKLPAVAGVDLGEQGYAVVRVTQVLPRDTQANGGDAAMIKQYAQAWSAAEATSYVGALKRRYKADIKEAAVAAAAAASAPAP